MTKKTSPVKQKPGPALVLFGLDQGEKPRAASFEAIHAKAAAKLADAMSLRVLKITTPEQAAVAAQLPAGRLYVSGKGFVPYVRQELYARVTGLVAAAEPARTNGAAKAAAAPVNGDKASAPANQAGAGSEANIANGQSDHQAQSGPLAGPAQPTITGFATRRDRRVCFGLKARHSASRPASAFLSQSYCGAREALIRGKGLQKDAGPIGI